MVLRDGGTSLIEKVRMESYRQGLGHGGIAALLAVLIAYWILSSVL